MKNTVTIFMLIDALGWDYIKGRDFVNDICPNRRPVKSLLGFSSGVIPSILTGRYPPQHKHWFLYYYSPDRNCFRWTRAITWLPKPMLNNRYTRKIVEEISKRLMGYTGYFETYLIPIQDMHLYDICENKRIYAPKGMREGKNIFDVLEENKVDYQVLAYPKKDQDIFAEACSLLPEANSTFYFLYFSESDAYLHRGCKDPQGTKEMIDFYETNIRKLYETAKQHYEQVNIFITSDHSMSPVYQGYDLKSEVEALGFKIPQDYVPFYDSTMGRFWFFNDDARKAINELLAAKQYGRILTEEEKKSRHVDFADNLYGETLFLMNNGCVINPCHMGHKPPEGMHGYDIDDGRMDAILLSNVDPGVDVNDVSDFYRIMERFAVQNVG